MQQWSRRSQICPEPLRSPLCTELPTHQVLERNEGDCFPRSTCTQGLHAESAFAAIHSSTGKRFPTLLVHRYPTPRLRARGMILTNRSTSKLILCQLIQCATCERQKQERSLVVVTASLFLSVCTSCGLDSREPRSCLIWEGEISAEGASELSALRHYPS